MGFGRVREARSLHESLLKFPWGVVANPELKTVNLAPVLSVSTGAHSGWSCKAATRRLALAARVASVELGA